MFQEIHNKIVQRQLQMGMVKNYLKKDNIFRKKVKKLLMILDLDNNDIIMEYQKTAEAASDLIGNKITKVSKNLPQDNSETIEHEHDKEILKERHISPEECQKTINDLTII